MKLSIGENIRRYRQEKGMTQEALAEAIGVSFQAVSRWETGCAYPDIEMIPRIARFFSVSADTLLGIDAASAEERKNEYRLAIRRLREEGKMEKALALSKEALREFPHDWYLLADFCDFLREEIYQGKTEYLSELRRNCNKIWEHCTDHDLQMKAIELMVCAAQTTATTRPKTRVVAMELSTTSLICSRNTNIAAVGNSPIITIAQASIRK